MDFVVRATAKNTAPTEDDIANAILKRVKFIVFGNLGLVDVSKPSGSHTTSEINKANMIGQLDFLPNARIIGEPFGVREGYNDKTPYVCHCIINTPELHGAKYHFITIANTKGGETGNIGDGCLDVEKIGAVNSRLLSAVGDSFRCISGRNLGDLLDGIDRVYSAEMEGYRLKFCTDKAERPQLQDGRQ